MQRTFRLIDVADLTPMNLPPSDKMVDSIRRYGVLNPVIVAETPDEDGVISLEIVDGNRRVVAAIRAGLEKVPAVVYQQAERTEMAALTVIANTQRSRNPVTEWQAVEELARIGLPDGEIMKVTGLTRSTLETRLRPSTMPDALRDAVHHGKILAHVWERASRLPRESQLRLAEMVEQGRTIRLADVDAERRGAEATQTEDEPGPVPAMGVSPTSHEQLVDQLTELARYFRTLGKSEYEWSKLTAEAWRRSNDDDREP